MSAGEGGEKPGDIGSALQRERGQLQSGNPAFGAALQGGNGLGRQVQPHDRLQKRARFGVCKTEVSSSYLGQLSLRSQPGQWEEGGISARGQEEVQVRRPVLQQKGHTALNGLSGDE